jgi:hypothetical protein
MRMLVSLLTAVLLFWPFGADGAGQPRGARDRREGPRRPRTQVDRDPGRRHGLPGRAELYRGHGLAAVQRAELHAPRELRHGLAPGRHRAYADAGAPQGGGPYVRGEHTAGLRPQWRPRVERDGRSRRRRRRSRSRTVSSSSGRPRTVSSRPPWRARARCRAARSPFGSRQASRRPRPSTPPTWSSASRRR